ncbi:MAG: hypothetical protein IKN27_11695 [Selenomonadaceae bacterium]|nr:hypothetical protein [Selenomonadaceae bacterium]
MPNSNFDCPPGMLFHWLADVFSMKSYDYYLKRTDVYCLVEKAFLSDDKHGIKVIFPRGTTDDKDRALYRLATAVRVLDKWHPHFMTPFDFPKEFLDKHNGKYHFEEDAIRKKMFGTNFFLFNRYGDSGYFLKCKAFPSESNSLILMFNDYDDENIETYREYIHYLIQEQRNDIHSFIRMWLNKYGTDPRWAEPNQASKIPVDDYPVIFKETADYAYSKSDALWKKATGLNRGSDFSYIEDRAASDIDLLLFCMALALDEKVYYRLRALRDEYSEQEKVKVTKSKYPAVGEDEENKLIEFLKDSYWRLSDARREEDKSENIPRRMLLNANRDLLKLGLKPIIHLEGNEVREIQEIIPAETLKGFYDVIEENGVITKCRLKQEKI